MNEEQTKRIADAADSLIAAGDALEEARATVADPRFDSDQERDRTQAAREASSKLENAGKRIEEAVRRGTIAAAVTERLDAYTLFIAATEAVREGRIAARQVPDGDGAAARKARGEEALAALDKGMAGAVALVFGE